jgi:hypothetical protein
MPVIGALNSRVVEQLLGMIGLAASFINSTNGHTQPTFADDVVTEAKGVFENDVPSQARRAFATGGKETESRRKIPLLAQLRNCKRDASSTDRRATKGAPPRSCYLEIPEACLQNVE